MSEEHKATGDTPDDASEDGSEPDERESDDASTSEAEGSDDGGASDSDDDDAERAERAAAPKPRTKKKKKKASATSAEQIRDRNQRVREQAAARRRADRERSKAAGGLDASELVDDALARSTHAATSWLKRNFNLVQWVVVVAIAGSVAWMIYSWRADRRAEKSSDALMLGVRAEQGRVGDTPADQESDETGIEDARAHYPTDAARLQAAADEYRKAIDVGGSSGAATLARLGLAGVLFQQKKYDEARMAYDGVRSSQLAANDADVRGRALEGLGMCFEAKGDRDGALKAFRELQNADLPGFTPLAMYHQARVLHAQGQDDKAKELIKTASEKVKAGRSPVEPATYVEIALNELLTAIDPISAAAAVPGGMSMDQIERLKAQLSQLQGMGDPKQLERLIKEMGGPTQRPGPPPAPSGSP